MMLEGSPFTAVNVVHVLLSTLTFDNPLVDVATQKIPSAAAGSASSKRIAVTFGSGRPEFTVVYSRTDDPRDTVIPASGSCCVDSSSTDSTRGPYQRSNPAVVFLTATAETTGRVRSSNDVNVLLVGS